MGDKTGNRKEVWCAMFQKAGTFYVARSLDYTRNEKNSLVNRDSNDDEVGSDTVKKR